MRKRDDFGCRTTREPDPCSRRGAQKGPISSLDQIVQRHISEHRPRAARELRYYKLQRSLEKAIEVAVLARMPSGKRHPHQRRIPGRVLEVAKEQLFSADLERCDSFAKLFATVEEAIRPIHGIGELAVYDTAQRIGAYLGLMPERVYLHAGTREGAKALGVDVRRKTVAVDELPEPLRALEAYEIEDCLCIYKAELKELSRA